MKNCLSSQDLAASWMMLLKKILSRGERTIKLLVQAAHELYSSLEQAALLVLLNNGYFECSRCGRR